MLAEVAATFGRRVKVWRQGGGVGFRANVQARGELPRHMAPYANEPPPAK